MKKGLFILLLSQGVYYLFTGLWPLIHISSFLCVTGPKTDLWIVKMVSLLTVCIGLALLKGTSVKNNTDGINILGITSAGAFLFVDFYYSLAGVISKVYLFDGFLQLVCLVAWCLMFFKKPLAVPRF